MRAPPATRNVESCTRNGSWALLTSAIRTRAGESRFTAADDAVLAGLAVLLLLCLWLRWNGYGVVEGVGF